MFQIILTEPCWLSFSVRIDIFILIFHAFVSESLEEHRSQERRNGLAFDILMK